MFSDVSHPVLFLAHVTIPPSIIAGTRTTRPPLLLNNLDGFEFRALLFASVPSVASIRDTSSARPSIASIGSFLPLLTNLAALTSFRAKSRIAGKQRVNQQSFT